MAICPRFVSRFLRHPRRSDYERERRLEASVSDRSERVLADLAVSARDPGVRWRSSTLGCPNIMGRSAARIRALVGRVPRRSGLRDYSSTNRALNPTDFAGYASGRPMESVERSVRLIRRPRRAPTPRSWLRTCAGRPAWTRRASLRSPTRIDRVASVADRVEQRRVDLVSLFHQFGDGPKRRGLRLDQVVGVNLVGPPLEARRRVVPVCRHGVHQPFRNLDRAGIAWMIATPSASSTTPTSSGSPFADGPMNIVTSASSVSKPRQWCRSAWSMSSSGTPCLRALASMSTRSGYASDCASSTFVDDSR